MNNLENIDSKILVNTLEKLVGEERAGLVKFLKILAEVERRKIHVAQGYSTLFSFLTKKYGFSEDCAQRRIQASRLCSKFAKAMEMIGDGRLHLSGLCVLASSLNEENAEELLGKAAGRSKRDIEEIVCYSKPAAKVRDQIKAIVVTVAPAQVVIPTSKSIFQESSAVAVAVVEVQKIEKVVVFKFSASETLQKKFERAKEVLWHKCPGGKFEEIFDAALDALLAAKDPEVKASKKSKEKKASQTKKSTRCIKASVKKEVWKRDEGRCVFTSADGHRCESKSALEFNHIIPWAMGGASTVTNLEMLCRAHNVYHAEQFFDPHRCG